MSARMGLQTCLGKGILNLTHNSGHYVQINPQAYILLIIFLDLLLYIFKKRLIDLLDLVVMNK